MHSIHETVLRTDYATPNSSTRRASFFTALAFGGSLLCSSCTIDNQPADRLDFLRNVTMRVPTGHSSFRRTGSLHDRTIATGEFLVGYATTTPESDIQQVNQWIETHGAHRIGRAPPINMDQYEVDSGVDMNTFLDSLQIRPGILSVQPNYVVNFTRDPNPPVQYNIDTGYWWISDVNLPQAWNITTGSSTLNRNASDKIQ